MYKRVRKDLLIICITAIIISAVVIFSYILTTGTDKVIQQVIRFCLTLLLSIFVLKDKMWAKLNML